MYRPKFFTLELRGIIKPLNNIGGYLFMSRLLVLTAQDDSLAVCRVHSQIVSVRRIADGIQIVVYHCKGLRFITYSSMVIELQIISMMVWYAH